MIYLKNSHLTGEKFYSDSVKKLPVASLLEYKKKWFCTKFSLMQIH